MSPVLSTAEQLALAVLRGDADAALALADEVQQTMAGTAGRLRPLAGHEVRRVTVERHRLRFLIFLKDNVEPPDPGVRENVARELEAWLTEQNHPLMVNGVERIEIYQLSEEPR